jgi:hypothetical protein
VDITYFPHSCSRTLALAEKFGVNVFFVGRAEDAGWAVVCAYSAA